MATLEGLPDPAQVSSADAAARAAAAEAANLAYRTNTAPVLAPYAAPSGITQAEQEDAAREAAKHAAAFHPAEYYGVNPADLGNVPLSQIASRYGTGMADIVQGYFTQNPTAEARAITSQYAAQHQIVENPYDPNTAAGIAWLSARQGTPVSASLGQKAIQQGYQGDLYAVSGISTVPVRDYSSGMLTGSKMVAALPSGTTTVFMPYGEYAQIEMKGAKALLDYQTGELGVYQQPYGHSQFMLTGGGGRAALQSGMFTVERPETPYVISQERAGTYVLPSGTGLSRLGAEAYGGFVRPLSAENLLAPNEAISRYYGAGGEINLANLVQQIPAGKAEVPGAKIPWSVEAGMPALSYMNERGVIPGSAITMPGESGRLVGSKVIAGAPTYGTVEGGILPSELPRPYISPSTGVIAPTGEVSVDIFGNKATLIPAGIWGVSDVIKFFQPQQRVTTTMTGETVLPEETRLVKTETTPLKEVSSYLGFTQKEIPGGIETTKYYEKSGGSETISTYEKTGGIQREFATTVAPIPKSSGLDIFESKIRQYLPSVAVGERGTEIASAVNPLSTGFAGARVGKEIAFGAMDIIGLNTKEARKTGADVVAMTDVYKGQYETFYEHPTMTALSVGAGGAMGLIAKPVESLYIAGRAGVAERAVSQGGAWRAAEQITGTVVSRAPQALAAMYSVDIAGRATEGFTNLSPVSAVPKARAIITQEAYPMMVGFEAPSQVVKAAKTAEIGYKSALQEGTAGGRLEYYVTQPVTKPYELAKQDYAAYLQENAPTLTPRQKIIKDVMEIQKSDAFTRNPLKETPFERGYAYSTTTGERITKQPIMGESPRVISGESIGTALDKYGGVDVAFYHTHPIAERSPFGELVSGIRAVKSGRITASEFLESAPRNVIEQATHRGTTPSISDITGGRVYSKYYGVEEEGVISGGKLLTYKTEVGGKAQPSKIYDVFASDVSKAYWEGGTLAGEQAFATTGSKLGFEPSVMTRAQMTEVLPKEPGLASYAQYKAERAVRSAAMPFQAFAQEAPGKIASAISATRAVPSKVVGIFDRPYAVETTRGYYPYADIEKAAYPKTAGTKLPTSQDILILGYSGYYGARASVIEKARGVGTAIKGGAERAVAVVSGEPGISVGVRPEPLGETLLNVLYTPRIGKVLPSSTFGETKPIGGFITTTVGGAKAEATGKPAGKPPAPEQFRKTPYGTGLAKEPSLKSMGISERAAPVGKSTLRGEQVTDFRGKPISERMKPMERGTYGPQGAQAAGQPRFLMEELPKVEGMTQGRVAPQEMRFVSVAPSLQQAGKMGVVQVTEPSLAFTQERRQQQFAGVIPIISVTPAAMISTAVESRSRQGVIQAARQAQITSVIPSFAQTAESRATQAARQSATRAYARDLITTPSTRTGMVTSITPFQSIDTRTSQTTKTSQIQDKIITNDPWKRTWTDPYTEKGGGGAAWPGGAVGSTPGTRKRRAAFVETFLLGLDLSLRPRRTKAAKSFTTPKKYKTKAPAKKKGGKK